MEFGLNLCEEYFAKIEACLYSINNLEEANYANIFFCKEYDTYQKNIVIDR